MDTEELVLCPHCNKEVAKVNFDLHKPHCERFLCKCPDCDDTVPRDQLEEHKTEQHTQVKCKMCNKKMERRHLLDHEKDECSKRPEICEFCQLELPLSSLKVHRVSCGSRTDRCSDCGQYVKLMDQSDHTQICSTTSTQDIVSVDDSSDESAMMQFDNSLKYIPSDSLSKDKLPDNQTLEYTDKRDDDDDDDEEEEEEEEKNNTKAEDDSDLSAADFSFSSRQKWKGDRNTDVNLDQIHACPLCHLALPVKTLDWHEKKCELYKHLNTT